MNISEELQTCLKNYRKRYPGSWGSLHIVLDDGNIRNKDVEFCLKYAQNQNDLEGIYLATELAKLSKTQRAKISDYIDGLLK